MSMLAKVRDERVGSAAEVLVRLEQVECGSASVSPSVPPPSAWHFARSERRIVSAVLAMPREAALEATIAIDRSESLAAEIAESARAVGGRLAVLPSGSISLVVEHGSSASEVALRALRFARKLRAELPSHAIAVATGSAQTTATGPTGQALDRAAGRLDDLGSGADAGRIRLDDATADVLEPRCVLGQDDHGRYFVAERPDEGASRLLLGRSVPFVGRERELATLDALFDECATDRVCRAVIVTAPTGTGKTRLRREFVDRVCARYSSLAVYRAQGDPMSAGSPYFMLAEATRAGLGFTNGHPTRERLIERLARSVPSSEVPALADALGDLFGFRAEPSRDEGQAAFRDPLLRSDHLAEAWATLVLDDARERPVLVLLDDLHWGDQPSISAVDRALRDLVSVPLFVLALARPELEERFPGTWAHRDVQQIRLGPLAPRACRALVESVMGDSVAAETTNAIVERAQGNPFFLEELVRAASRGDGRQIPDSILAILQGRLDTLPQEGRRMLRVASVFGVGFWSGGAAALMGVPEPHVLETLGMLQDAEIVVSRPRSRFPSTREYQFRHPLLREAAYAALTDDDRARAHRAAVQWLLAHEERDTLAIAEHFERAGDRDAAAHHFVVAADEALGANDLAGALHSVERAVSLGAAGDDLGTARLLEAEIRSWRGELAQMRAAALDALALLPPGSSSWLAAASLRVTAESRLGDGPGVLRAVDELPVLDAVEAPSETLLTTYAKAVPELLKSHHIRRAFDVARKLRSFGADRSGDVLLRAWTENAIAWVELYDNAVAESLAWDQRAAASFATIGDRRNECRQRLGCGFELLLLGAYERAESELRESLKIAARLGLESSEVVAKHNLGLVLALTGRYDEAIALEREAVAHFAQHGERRIKVGALIYLSRALQLAGRHAEAEVAARDAIESAGPEVRLAGMALALLAVAELERGEPAKALESARHAYELTTRIRDAAMEYGHFVVETVLIDSLVALGRRDEARALAETAVAYLRECADRITDVELRASYLARVPENARLRVQAKELGVAL